MHVVAFPTNFGRLCRTCVSGRPNALPIHFVSSHHVQSGLRRVSVDGAVHGAAAGRGAARPARRAVRRGRRRRVGRAARAQLRLLHRALARLGSAAPPTRVRVARAEQRHRMHQLSVSGDVKNKQFCLPNWEPWACSVVCVLCLASRSATNRRAK